MSVATAAGILPRAATPAGRRWARSALACAALAALGALTALTGSATVATLLAGALFALLFVLRPLLGVGALLLSRTTLDAFGPEVVAFRMAGKPFPLHMVISIEAATLLVLWLLWSGLLPAGRTAAPGRDGRRLEAPALLFILYTLVGVGLAADRFVGFAEWLRLVTWVALLLVTARAARSRQDVVFLLGCGALGALVPAASVAWSLATGQGVGGFYGGHEVRGWYGAPANLAGTFYGVLPFVAYRALAGGEGWPSRRFATLLLGAVAVGVFFTFYRSIWIACAIFALTLLMHLRVRLMLVAGGVAIIMLLLWQNRGFVQERTRDLPVFGTMESGKWGQERVGVWLAVLGAWSQASWRDRIVGQGTLSSRRYSGITKTEDSGDEVGKTVHNDFIELLVSHGLIGLGLFLWLVARVFGGARALLRRAGDGPDRALAAATLGTLGFLVPACSARFLASLASMVYLAGFWGLAHAALRRRAAEEAVA